mmetsp:Transcript_10322/g.44822  ORF Transcript_10322/g.44822 Transcript_10322/m.44822 type:complete len:459 (+) Transcript_10322:1145-2521(+)
MGTSARLLGGPPGLDGSSVSLARSANDPFAESEGVVDADQPPPLSNSPKASSSAGTQTPPPGKRTLTRRATGPPVADSLLTRSAHRTLAPRGQRRGTPWTATTILGIASTTVNASRFSRGTSRTHSWVCAARRVLGARTSKAAYPSSTRASVHATPTIRIFPGVLGTQTSLTVFVSLGDKATLIAGVDAAHPPSVPTDSPSDSSSSHTSLAFVTLTSTFSGLRTRTSTPMGSPSTQTFRWTPPFSLGLSSHVGPPTARSSGGISPSSSSAFHLLLGHAAHAGSLTTGVGAARASPPNPRSTRWSLNRTCTSPASTSGAGGLGLAIFSSPVFPSIFPLQSPAGTPSAVSIARWHTKRYSLRYVTCVAAGWRSAHVSNSRKYRPAPVISPACATCLPSAKCRCSFALDHPAFAEVSLRSPDRTPSRSSFKTFPSTPSRLHDAASLPSGAPSCAYTVNADA